MMARRVECSEGYVEPGMFIVNHLVKYWLVSVDVNRSRVHMFGIDATLLCQTQVRGSALDWRAIPRRGHDHHAN